MPKSKPRHRREAKHVAELLLVSRCQDCGRWLVARGRVRSVSEHQAKTSAVAAARRIHNGICAGPNRKPHLFVIIDPARALEELTGDELPSIH